MVLISHPESDTTMSVTRVKRIALLKAVIRASLIDRTCGEPRTAVARGDFPPWCGVCGQMVHPSCTIVKPKETTRRTKPTEGTTTIQASKAERSNDVCELGLPRFAHYCSSIPGRAGRAGSVAFRTSTFPGGNGV